ncbi:dTMP kinase [Alterinioella nitratireducens]|uniref:dTMP kinase n=2 Tax=Alterinioella nitratireducens TaxID=2735915 RepID=UPI001551F4B7|nr:dTMP kinase [Alterinioella nitratireducens]NPD20470.1 dTMP kinase [Alterinioella nitratireducens]
MFLSLEGIDGSGKSTQATRLADTLRAAGHDVVQTREPGGAPGAEEIRRLLVEGDPERWSPETETLLFNAARRDHLERTIRPALEAGKIVITDRFADSTRVYQGATRGDLRGFADAIHKAAIGVEPDLTLILDMDPAAALTRGLARSSGEDRFEEFGLPFQQALRAGFLSLADEFPARCHIIDAGRDADAIAADIRALVLDRLT